MRIHQKEGICPQGFILIPKVWKDRSLVEELASFNLYARDVQLFFVCRMFFEELEAVADVEDTIYEHEFSDPMILQLPRVRTQIIHSSNLISLFGRLNILICRMGVAILGTPFGMPGVCMAAPGRRLRHERPVFSCRV